MKTLKTNFLVFISLLSVTAFSQTRLVIDSQSHSGVVNGLAFTSNGRYLISVSDDKTIRIWDVANGNLDRTIRSFSGEGPNGAIYALALSPDDRFLAIGGYFSENEIRIIDLKRDSEVVVLKGHRNVITSIKFSTDGLQLASADVAGIINLWDIGFSNNKITGTLRKQLRGHTAQVYDISFSPDAKQLVSASYDGSLRLWYIKEAKEPVIMRMHIDKVYSCAFSSDGKWILSGGNKGKVIVWNNEGTFSRYMASLDEPINSISIKNSDVIVSADKGYHYSLSNASDIHQMPVSFSQTSASAISNNGLAALAGGPMGEIIIYNLDSNEPTQVFKNNTLIPKEIGISNDGILVFNIDGKGFTKGFNLKELTYVWNIDKTKTYVTEVHKEGGYTLTPMDKYTLSTGFKGKVDLDPRIDGRLRSFSLIDENTIAIGGDFSLKLYTRDGEFKKELKGFNGAITSVASSNNRIVAVSSDQKVNVWNLETGELLASLFLAPNDDWICWTPQGFYEASSGGEKYMGWQEDNSPTELSIFYKSSVFASKFHQHELVRQTLSLGNFKTAQERVKLDEVPVQEEVISEAPKINWVTPEEITSNLENGKVTIKALVKSSSEINTVKILINGRPAPSTRGVAIPKSVGEHDMLIEQELNLSHEVNEVRIFVSNKDAKTVSEKRIFNLDSAAITGKRSLDIINYEERPDLYIVSIGVSKYSNKEYDLNYADLDAESIAGVFDTLGTDVYKKVYITRLMNEEATRSAIIGAFKVLDKKVKDKDMVLIFIASHGINDHGEFYILPHDGDLRNIAETLVSWKSISETLGTLPSNVLVFIDACKSGQLGVNLSNANNTEAVRTASSDENGLVIMAASTGSETARESPDWKHGAFTLSLLEGLKNGKADIKPDGTIYLRELDFYVSERTVELTNNAQHPTTQKPSTIGRFSVIKLN